MKTEFIRLGLVGYGANRAGGDTVNGGRGDALFSLATTQIDGVMASAVCDVDPGAHDRAAKKYPGIRLFEDYQTLLAANCVDAIIIGTPVQIHAPIAVAAMKAGIPVLSEIPAVWTQEEARALWETQAATSAFYMAGANPNFLGYIDAMVDLKRRSLLGEPVYAEAEYFHDLRKLSKHTPWRATLEPIRYCTHSLGPLLRVIDEDLKYVSCFGTGSHLNRQEGQEDFMVAILRTRSGIVVRLLVSFINQVANHHHYRLYTTKGCFERTRPSQTSAGFVPAEAPRTLFQSSDLPLNASLMELPVGDLPPAYASNPKATGHGGIDYAMLDAFVKAIRTGGPSPIPLREGLRMSLPGLFAAQSARNGGQLTEIVYPWESEQPSAPLGPLPVPLRER